MVRFFSSSLFRLPLSAYRITDPHSKDCTLADGESGGAVTSPLRTTGDRSLTLRGSIPYSRLSMSLGCLLTWACLEYEIFWNIQLALVVSPIIFPLAFSINESYRRREKVRVRHSGALLLVLVCQGTCGKLLAIVRSVIGDDCGTPCRSLMTWRRSWEERRNYTGCIETGPMPVGFRLPIPKVSRLM